MTFGIALACALGAPAAATAATIHVDETQESATFVAGGPTPAGYHDSIDDVSNHNGRCSLREAIKASNTDAPVDGCAAGDGPGDIVVVPAGRYDLYDNLIVQDRVVIRGANAGRPGNDPHRGAETTIRLVNNPESIGQPALFWLGAPSPSGPASGGGSEFDGLTLAGNSNPLCINDPGASSTGPCEEWAIVQPEKSGGGSDTAPGLKLRDSIVRDFTAAVYLGGAGAVVKHDLFEDNSRLLGNPSVVNAGVDLYSDAVYANTNPVIDDNVFANPRIAAVELQGVGTAQPEPVVGGLIRGNLINLKNGEPYFAVLLLNTHGQRVQDNLIRDPRPPAVQTLCCTDGIELDAVHDVEINGNTITGLAAALRVSEAYGGLPGLSDVHAKNNRFYGNLHGIRVFNPYPQSSLDATHNWWGANGGAGSDGSRPGATNPVNGVWFGHIDWAHGGAIVEDPPPSPNWIDASHPLQLGCSMPTDVTANTPVPLTGSVPGMPAVDRTASASPWFEPVHIPLMAANVSGVPGGTFGFDQPPTNGISGGQVINRGGSLTGVLVATASGAGAGQVALDSEQVACPFHAAPENVKVDKTTETRVARPGDLVTFRIRVTNRGHAPVRGLRACDRAPRALRFVRSTPRLRHAPGRRRCLRISTLRPGQRRTFHATFRLRANVTAQVVSNGATVDTTAPPPLPPSSAVLPETERHPVARDTRTITVRTRPPSVTG